MTRVSNAYGGAAAAGGFGFQAKLGAIACVHTLRGTPIQWTDCLTGASPFAVSFETSGSGDDLSLELTDGSVVEVQAKMGLRADKRFWSALYALCEGIHHDRCSYGILIVCPNSSTPVRRGYALALERIGVGRNDGASPEQAELATRLAARGYDAVAICARLRIRTVSALEDAGDAIAAARAELGHVCADDRQVMPAWHALCQDALMAMANKSRRTLRNLSARLRASGINVANTVTDSPVVISDHLLRWTMSRTEHFDVLGISRPLPTDQAWLPLIAVVRDVSVEQAPSVEQALADYHAMGKKSRPVGDVIDANTIGTFRKLCVVVGGPGSGKSLLLKVLAREFAKDSYVSVHVRLRDLATRMRETGCGVEEGLLHLGLDGTRVSPKQLRAASLSDLVLLCDGLDECGDRQFDIAAGLQDISASHPSYRVVVTTRPIGYSTSELREWRHYEIAPLAEADTAEHLETLCRYGFNDDNADNLDEFLPRIRAYLKEGSASRMLARSPLLLAFGAALYLNWRDPSKTKLQLYQRIFRLVDGTPARRDIGSTPPAKAIRNSILNHLGWLVVASPLRAAEELEIQCARKIQQSLGIPYLEALAIVESAIGYWEKKGLIERLHHPDIDLIAFIHKTCGEFSAANHLSEMEPDQARQEIRVVLSNADWNEILDFAIGTPLANIVAEFLVEEFEAADPADSTLTRLFGVLARPDTALSLKKRRSFLDRVLALALSEDRQKAYRIGHCMTEHDLSCIPEAEHVAWSLIAAPQEWSRLIGWAVLACHFAESVHRGALEDAVDHFMERSNAEDFFVLRPSERLGIPFPDRRVFEKFLLAALNSLLSDQDPEYRDRLVTKVCQSQRDATMGFMLQFEALIKDSGREHLPLHTFGFSEEFGPIGTHKFAAGCKVLLTDVVPSAFLRKDCGPPPPTGLKCLAAFCDLIGIMHVPASDVLVWLSDDTQLDAVHALLRAIAYVYELPAERLATEAREAVAIVESQPPKEKKTFLLDALPDVDVPEANWDRASKFGIDLDLVEHLIHHPSRWVQYLAMLVINDRLHGGARRRACNRMLAVGTGNALRWAAALTARLPDGPELLVHRLGGTDTAGLHHLFYHLNEQGYRVTKSHLTMLENGLVSRSAKTAVSAARWCADTASSTDTWLVDLLRSASSYWIEYEEPYPEAGGTIPDSPRADLLRTLCGITPPAIEELITLAGDPRRDVRDVAIDGLIGLAENLNHERSKLVESIMAKRFSTRQCEKLLGSKVPYRSDELLTLQSLCNNQDPAYRLVAVRRVLTHPAMDPERALAAANSMKEDSDGNVRDVVHWFLDRQAPTSRTPLSFLA